ncbi:MAG: monofunctional biosynthetic peptidoglycan transglycosylase [Deltaproteobacteria bacterium]|nr:monofunctional biosynthetic peptidoglycan transglycosylase [Deltaproteobacteria bacterium]
MRRPLRRLLAWTVQSVLLVSVAATALVAILAVLPPPTTAFMLQDRVTRFGASRSSAIAYTWKSWREISPQLLIAVIAAEDQRFPEHWGFDLQAIEKAAEHNRRGGSVRGASTLTQQVAKNLFLWSGRSYLRKGVEAGLTALLETGWSKLRILEVYVNVAQFGDAVYGADAASRRFFAKPASRLTAAEAALLAAVLPDPESLHVDRPSVYLRRRQRWILAQMTGLGGPSFLRRVSPLLSASREGSGSP